MYSHTYSTVCVTQNIEECQLCYLENNCIVFTANTEMLKRNYHSVQHLSTKTYIPIFTAFFLIVTNYKQHFGNVSVSNRTDTSCIFTQATTQQQCYYMQNMDKFEIC